MRFVGRINGAASGMASSVLVVTLASVAVISFTVGGAGAVAIDVLISPIMRELRWSNSVTSSLASAFSLSMLVAGPIVGIALDKFRARPTMSIGVLLGSAGLFLVSHSYRPGSMLLGFALAGIGNCATFYIPMAVIIANCMQANKSFGMGIVWGATSLGAACFSILMSSWIDSHGWRTACKILSVLVMLMLPLIALTVKEASPRRSDYAECAAKISSRSFTKVLGSGPFVLATLSGALFAIGMFSIYYHVVSLLIDAGYRASSAGTIFGLSWILSALGSLLLGLAAGRFGAKGILASALLLGALGTFFLLGVGGKTLGIGCVGAFVILWGMSANAMQQFIPVIFAEQFGLKSLGTLVGIQSFVMGIAGASAPMITGAMHDKFNDYRFAIIMSGSAMLLAFVAAASIGRLDRTAYVMKSKDARECL